MRRQLENWGRWGMKIKVRVECVGQRAAIGAPWAWGSARPVRCTGGRLAQGW